MGFLKLLAIACGGCAQGVGQPFVCLMVGCTLPLRRLCTSRCAQGIGQLVGGSKLRTILRNKIQVDGCVVMCLFSLIVGQGVLVLDGWSSEFLAFRPVYCLCKLTYATYA